MNRFFIRSTLIIALSVSVGAIAAAFWYLGPGEASTWATVAAALAVVTSVISSWTSQRSLELQQDALNPYPYPTIDIESRYNLIQLRITNYGGGVAHDISLKWDKPLINSRGKAISFTKQDEAPEIPILLPNESMSTLIDGSMQLFQNVQDMNYTGFVEFKDASNKKHKHRFHLSIEKYRGTLSFATEDPKTHHELQKLPQEIQRLAGELRAIRAAIQADYRNDDQQTENPTDEFLTNITSTKQSENSLAHEEAKLDDISETLPTEP